ncbi:Unknown protein, partial [Striga hermonthica]
SNAIIGRTALYKLRAAVSIFHYALKFPTTRGEGTHYGDQREARELITFIPFAGVHSTTSVTEGNSLPSATSGDTPYEEPSREISTPLTSDPLAEDQGRRPEKDPILEEDELDPRAQFKEKRKSDRAEPGEDVEIIYVDEPTRQKEPDHQTPTQATVVAQFRDYHAEKFSGQGDPRIVDVWIQGLEFIFEVMDCPDRYRVVCAQLQLTGDARLWWNAYWSMRPGEKEGCTWDRLKELIREKYYPSYYRAEMERQFLSLQQGTRSVDEYEEFTRLAGFVPDLVRTEAQRAHRFIDGLYPAVRHNIVGHGTQTYAHAVAIAQEVDASIRREAVREQSQPSAPAQSSSAPLLPLALPVAQPPKNNKRKGKGAQTDRRT